MKKIGKWCLSILLIVALTIPVMASETTGTAVQPQAETETEIETESEVESETESETETETETETESEVESETETESESETETEDPVQALIDAIESTTLVLEKAECTGFQNTVEWQPVDVDIDNYYVYRRTADTGWKGLSRVSADSTSYVDKTAKYGVKYYYTVRAYKKIDGTNYLTDFDRTGLSATVAPGAPVILSECLNYQSAKIQWTEVAGAESYALYVRNATTGKWTYATKVTGTSYILKTVCGRQYTYTVRACKTEDGKTVLSAFDKNGTTFQTLPDTPVLKSAVSKGYNSVDITWEAADGAQKYCIYRKTAGKGYQLVGTTTKLTYTDTSVTCGTSYVYTVRAYTVADGKFVLSDFDKNGLAVKPIPATPVLKTISGADYKKVTVKWDVVPGAQSYYIYRKEVGGKWALVGSTSGNSKVSYTDTTVSASKVYIYTVRACRVEGGQRVLSDFDATGTYWIDYPLLGAAVADASEAVIQWEEIEDVDGYCIYRKVEGGSWKLLAKIQGQENTYYQDKSGKEGTYYLYTVRAYCEVNKKSVLSDFDRVGSGIVKIGLSPVVQYTKYNGNLNGINITMTNNSSKNIYFYDGMFMSVNADEICLMDLYNSTNVITDTVRIVPNHTYTLTYKISSVSTPIPERSDTVFVTYVVYDGHDFLYCCNKTEWYITEIDLNE